MLLYTSDLAASLACRLIGLSLQRQPGITLCLARCPEHPQRPKHRCALRMLIVPAPILIHAGMQGVHWGHRLPSVTLLHGTADTCAPVGNAKQFAEALREAGAEVG